MSSVIDEPGADVGEPGSSEGDAGVLFAGDTGQLPLDARRVLVQLLLGPALDAQRQTKLWPVLLRDEAVLRSRLHDLFLDLVIDYDQGVAFTRQVSDESLDVPILLRKAPLTFIQSSLLLFLRQQLIQADARGERAVVSRQDMLEHLRAFEPDRNVDRAKFERQANGAVEKADQLNLLRCLRGTDERYEISPALKLIFPAEEIQALTDAYLRLSAGAAHGAPEHPAGAGEEES